MANATMHIAALECLVCLRCGDEDEGGKLHVSHRSSLATDAKRKASPARTILGYGGG